MAKKTIRINESTARHVKRLIMGESFHPDRTKVLSVKDFLDKNFKRTSSDDIVDGYPSKVRSVALMGTGGEPLKIMSFGDLLLMLDDRFMSLIKDDADRRAFLKAVITDWYNRAITREGILTSNTIE